jgi:TatA/E family protein of Tat protein translocase
MIGSTELIAILIAALFLFGPKKLPELARSLGSAVGEFKKAQMASEMQLTHFDAYTRKDENQSCAGAPRCKQRGMFAPPLQIPLRETITQNNLV